MLLAGSTDNYVLGFTTLTKNCPKHLGANYSDKSHAVGAREGLLKILCLPGSLSRE